MNGTNPGAWPDQEPKVVKCCRCGHPFVMAADFCGNILCEECDSQMSSKTVDLKAARLETVERCISIAADPSLIASELDEIIERLEMLKEEINMKKSCFHKGFNLSGEIISDDWEGDPSIPGGVRKIPPYVDDLKVEAGGIDHAAAGNLSEKFLAECEEILTARV